MVIGGYFVHENPNKDGKGKARLKDREDDSSAVKFDREMRNLERLLIEKGIKDSGTKHIVNEGSQLTSEGRAAEENIHD